MDSRQSLLVEHNERQQRHNRSVGFTIYLDACRVKEYRRDRRCNEESLMLKYAATVQNENFISFPKFGHRPLFTMASKRGEITGSSNGRKIVEMASMPSPLLGQQAVDKNDHQITTTNSR
jgi:hypothetical protein